MLRPARQAGLYAVFGHAAPKCPVIPQTRLISQSAADTWEDVKDYGVSTLSWKSPSLGRVTGPLGI